jgi:hypothetical protein
MLEKVSQGYFFRNSNILQILLIKMTFHCFLFSHNVSSPRGLPDFHPIETMTWRRTLIRRSSGNLSSLCVHQMLCQAVWQTAVSHFIREKEKALGWRAFVLP